MEQKENNSALEAHLHYTFIVYDNKQMKDNFPVYIKITNSNGVVLHHAPVIGFDTIEKARRFSLEAIMNSTFDMQVLKLGYKEENEK